MSKTFKTVDVLQAYTGHILVDGGFSQVHGIFDHFCPGIYTLGCAAMAKPIANEIEKQHPELKLVVEKLGAIPKKNYESWREKALKLLPATMELTGNLSPSRPCKRTSTRSPRSATPTRRRRRRTTSDS
jgi:hypothetical protein